MVEKTIQVKVIDATGLLLGRLASQVAKMALLGQKVAVVNCEKVIVSGSKASLLSRFKPRSSIGRPFHGPFASKMPDRIVRRAIRGMLPFHKSRGRDAFRRVVCYIGNPEELRSIKAVTMQSALAENKLKSGGRLTVGSIASLIGKYKGRV